MPKLDASSPTPSLAARLFGIDLRALSAYRVGLAGVLLLDLISRARDLEAHYCDAGVLPRAALLEKFSRLDVWSLHLTVGSVWGQTLLFTLHALFALMLLVGYRTRLATWLCWLLIVSVQSRNEMVVDGGDVLLRAMFFWAGFLPLGAHWAVDAWRAGPSQARAPRVVLSAATVATLLQLVGMYVLTAVEKSHAAWHWPEAGAISMALSLDQFARPLGLWLRQFPTPLRYATVAVFWLELWGPLLLFVPPWRNGLLRSITTLTFMLFHVGLWLTLELGLFPLICIICWIVFLPSPFWDALTRRLTGADADKLTIFYDKDCGFCRRMVDIVRAVLALPQVPAQAAQDVPAIEAIMTREHSWVLRLPDGQTRTRSAALAQLLSYSPVARPLHHLWRIPGIEGLADAVYGRIAHGRHALGPWLARWSAGGKAPSRHLHPAAQLGVVCAMVVVVSWNAWVLPQVAWQNPRWLQRAANALRLDQRWLMFAPYPSDEDGWYVIAGKLANGAAVDALHQRFGAPSRARPTHIAPTFINTRWRKYFVNLWAKSNAGHRLYYGRYLCRAWAKAHPRRSPLYQFTITYMLEKTSGHGAAPPKPIELWHHSCFYKASDKQN